MGVPKGILPGNLALDPEQDVNEWIYDLTGDFKIAEGQYNFRNHYALHRRSAGPGGVEHVTNVSIHNSNTGTSEDIGLWFSDYPG